MPKMKTHKATAKRFIVKRSKKGVTIVKRTDGQDHFNARERGNTRRNKRSDITIAHESHQTILRALPYA